MLTFSKFLLEVARSVPRAQKLLTYLAKRQGAQTDSKNNTQIKTIIPHISYLDVPSFINPKTSKTVEPYEHAAMRGKLQNIKISDLITSQEKVQKEIVSKKLEGKWPKHKPMYPHGVLIHAPGHDLHGKVLIRDGNHRAYISKLQGQEHLLMKVATVNIHPDDMEFYNQMKEKNK